MNKQIHMPPIQTIRKPAPSVRKGELPGPNTYKICIYPGKSVSGGNSHPEVDCDPGNNSYYFK